MKRTLSMVYAIACYALALGAFAYGVGFVGNFGVPRSLDVGPSTPLRMALVIDALLLGVFAVQHSVMARAWFKRWWTRIVPPAVERSTFVLFASLALILMYWQWRPIGDVLWEVGGTGRTLLIAVSLAGWLAVFASTFLTSHSDLFGLRQAWLYFKGEDNHGLPFSDRGFYKMVRHPIYLGFTVAFWATPTMTMGHLVFAMATLLYMLAAIQFEERDLVRIYGDVYRAYRERVAMILPVPRRGSSAGEPNVERV